MPRYIVVDLDTPSFGIYDSEAEATTQAAQWGGVSTLLIARVVAVGQNKDTHIEWEEESHGPTNS